MLAARYYTAGDIRVEEVADPVISQADDIIVEVALCGICGTDLHEYQSGPIVTPKSPHPLTHAQLPQILGHEFSGTIVEKGPAVSGLAIGTKVAIMPSVVCHECYFCRRGMQALCTKFASLGLSAESGGLARYAKVKPYNIAPLPESMSFEEGALVEPAAVAAYGVDRGNLVGGDNVLIIGAGPIGILSALYADAMGAGTIAIVEPNAQRAKLARELNVGPVLDPTAEETDDALREVTQGLGMDLTIECSGTGAGLALGIDQTRRRGGIVQTGLHTKPAQIDAMRLSENELTIYGSWCFSINDWPRVIRLIERGKYPVEKALTSVIDIKDVVGRGFDALSDPNGNDLKILVRP
ncbi:2,3-butanediol dehydrogenase [Pseudarthrobacter enclensis]|uniref:(R,R)-butanediol dehydrogenase/meso-butanediol dehydrogenase/diacetyl reductase n=1 Tax=Pseudarthrobacter enclensis TaxID=993070 RepID=A0ABT9RWG4_9MICC|nr:2,3-butanediol dehydrogenase [Pseudarthrobacter enclensis]MDP9889090.1 (R,R)-butanediol dehydrogenase/meso-butanediol dehydrogenase/diacetyl reductase [Pseudarthrobacter enclensis]